MSLIIGTPDVSVTATKCCITLLVIFVRDGRSSLSLCSPSHGLLCLLEPSGLLLIIGSCCHGIPVGRIDTNIDAVHLIEAELLVEGLGSACTRQFQRSVWLVTLPAELIGGVLVRNVRVHTQLGK